MQLFAEPYIFGGGGTVTGGSDRQFQTLGLYLYEEAYRTFDFGYGAAIAWVMFVLIVIASLLSYGLTRLISRTS
jgi:cellobiose transport system permease protein